MSQHADGFRVPDRADLQFVRGDPKRPFRVGRRDVTFPQCGWIGLVQVRPQQVTALRQRRPIAPPLVPRPRDTQPGFPVRRRQPSETSPSRFLTLWLKSKRLARSGCIPCSPLSGFVNQLAFEVLAVSHAAAPKRNGGRYPLPLQRADNSPGERRKMGKNGCAANTPISPPGQDEPPTQRDDFFDRPHPYLTRSLRWSSPRFRA